MAFEDSSKSSLKTIVTDTATIRLTGGVVDDDSSSSEEDNESHSLSNNPHKDTSGGNTGLQCHQSPRAQVHVGAHGVDNKNISKDECSGKGKAGIKSSQENEEALITGLDKVDVHTEVNNHSNLLQPDEQITNYSETKVQEKKLSGNPHPDEGTTVGDNNVHAYTSSTTSLQKNYTTMSSSSLQRFNPFNRLSDLDEQDTFPQLTERQLIDQTNKLNFQRSFDSDEFSDDLDNEDETRSPLPLLNAELGITEDHFAQPEGHFGLTTVEELELAIQNCKQLVLQTPPGSDRMKNLVRKLIQLRLKRSEAMETPEEGNEEYKLVVGHRFEKFDSKSSKRYCEKCNSVIWGVLQPLYKCVDCGFCSHFKCLNLITRTCASVKVIENPNYLMLICPEKGLAAQNYRCAECRAPLSYQAGFSEPRQCDYTGSFYCDMCHWNDLMVIPARVLHNWDFDPRKVARASKQFLKLIAKKAVIRIQDVNPMLFSLVEELNDVKRMREEILIMKKYFLSCKGALESKLLLQLKERQHFVESSDMYSICDLEDIVNDVLLPQIAKIHASFAQHIKTDCQLCQVKGYICELCDEQEILFPFDNIAIVCSQCSTVFHRHCYMRRNQRCPKCERISRRSADLRATSSAFEDSLHAV